MLKLTRNSVNVTHRLIFQRPAASLVTQGGRLLEALLDHVAIEYTVLPQDIHVKSGQILDECSLRISMFNGLGKVAVTAAGVECSFQNLSSDKDLEVVADVVDRVLLAVSSHTPTLKSSAESISGNVSWRVLDGALARAEYFGRVLFPGRTSVHEDVSVRARIRHHAQPSIGSFELAPRWGETDQAVLFFDVDLSELKTTEFKHRVTVANELIQIALTSFDLEQVKA